MTNMKTEVKNNKLIIEVDLNQSGGPSKSGKTLVIASSHGAAQVADKDGNIVNVNLNVYKKR